ncbi:MULTISPECIES: hypothetical protein [Streptomyces]|uniref:Uncharacterized protein n=1 Tax=Streptomyces tsukubensis (strain DSM 42081 / NBRC 108919 / NRRL 18488 / 9993) TaxID=1114943 RepID=I2N8C9_STRT9|nr:MULTISPECIES: hypothetical protein [Streptomyces]AZK97162.1 hypothetical protein B7R87_27290 [Streptomyces tsukubensis]EIF93276.1 hypothetical protein [Streptomyces tsukubensis NRRL18488]MYS68195.1 hypothetical protein [Streptomyces sp. SID5473]QKM66870.1 hypothetical protein STSU_006475 [Streptomyces tsukubensis NRRL18488]TAI44783.1 hypothetical protein EWI31_05755 [Streptomyces tsukubensis]
MSPLIGTLRSPSAVRSVGAVGSSRTLGRFAATAVLAAAAALTFPAAASAATPGTAPAAATASAWTYVATYPSYQACYLASLSVGDLVSTQCRPLGDGRAELWVNG